MSSNTPPNKDLKTRGYVLKRTNYGEADRILNIITPEGKIAVIAKSARKPKSKLAGGIELFTLSEYNIHLGRSELGVLTGAKMIQYHSEILKDFAKIELATIILKKINVASESSDSPEYFNITDKCLTALNTGYDTKMIEAWYSMNLAHIMGEDINLYRDTNGAALKADAKYTWDNTEKAFYPDKQGAYGANEIKMLRLIYTADLDIIKRVILSDEIRNKIITITKQITQNT